MICNPGNIEMVNGDDETDSNVKQNIAGVCHDWNTSGETEGDGDVKERSYKEKRAAASMCDEATVVASEDKEIPAFVCMDSLKCHPLKKNCRILRKYLEEEWKCQKDRHEYAIKMKEAELVNAGVDEKRRMIEQIQKIPIRITARNFPDVHPEVPTQENSCDCGVFLLKYAAWFFEKYIKGNPIRITQRSVAKKLNGAVDKNMFRYRVVNASSKC